MKTTPEKSLRHEQPKDSKINEEKCQPTGKFSYFKNPINAAPPICPHTNIGLDQLYIEITNESHKLITLKLRDITNKMKAKESKEKNFPYITPNGTCTQRNQEYFTNPSGYYVIDFDDVADIVALKEKLISDPELRPIFFFISPSGKGIKALYNIDVSLIDYEASSNKMHRLFYSFNNYLSIFYSDILKPDAEGHYMCSANKDLLRPCFVCHDPEAYYDLEEKTIIDKKFTQWYYNEPEHPQQSNGQEWTFESSPDIASIATKHLISESHHPQILRFACACLHYDIDP